MTTLKFIRRVIDALSGLGTSTAKDTMVSGPEGETPEMVSAYTSGASLSYPMQLASLSNPGIPLKNMQAGPVSNAR